MTVFPAIDVLLPVHNAKTTLDETLSSIVGQSFHDFRVIAIDDGSTDGSDAVLAHWADQDPRIKIIMQTNAGIVAALNTALAAASAPLIARMDADDLCNPERFRLQFDYLQAHPETIAVAGRVTHIDETGRKIAGLPQPGNPEDADENYVPGREPYLIHPFLMARRESLIAVGGYRYVPNSEDSDLDWRLREIGRLHNLSEELGSYRMHNQSISGSGIIGGRIMAVGSQLGACAARARARGKGDAGFSDDLVPALKVAVSLEAMCAQVHHLVAPEDQVHFKLAVGIKLLELAAYRPYALETADCRFIAEQVRSGACLPLSAPNRKEINWYLSEAAARLLRKGRALDAARLSPGWIWPATLAKTMLR